jgi:hypothetical protein
MRYLLGFICVAGFAALLALIPPSASAQAQSDSVVLSPGRLELAQPSELQIRLAALEAAYQDANVRKPRAGVAVSVIVIAAGLSLVTAGAFLRPSSGFGTPTEHSIRVGNALFATGWITVAGGVTGLAFSGVRLKRAKRERRRLDPEIERLRSALESDAE